MKLSLLVTAKGNAEGKVIPITLAQFVIGRDPQCQLRPASPLISKRHCAVLVRGSKVFLRDFGSTNGSFVNDTQIKGEIELNHGDDLKIGPLCFRVQLETTPPLSKPTPVPGPSKAAAPSDDDSAAALLLDLGDEAARVPGGPVDPDGIPQGSTVMDVPSAMRGEEEEVPAIKADAKKETEKKNSANTSDAAKAILDKYTRRTRS